MSRPTRILTAAAVLAITVALPAISLAEQPDAGDPAGPSSAPPAEPEPAPTDQTVTPKPQAPESEPEPKPAPVAPAAEPDPPAQPEPARTRQVQAAASLSVSIGDNFYSPAQVTIDAGDSVTWVNDGQAPHSATADNGSFDTGVFNSGQSRSVTFSQAGTFSYFCTVHGQAQSGTVVVRSAGTTPDPGATDTGASENGGTGPVTSGPDGPTLPETGLAVLLLAAIGWSLVGSGEVLRRRAR